MSPPAGRPDTLKPSHELYGEIRVRADAHLPELREARDYLAHTAER